MQQRPRQHLQLSLTSLCALASYWPSRAPLAFAAAQPRCRIAAESRIVGAFSDDDVENEYQAVWTDWASQIPFGDWWVSDLAERVMPSGRQFGSEVQLTGSAGDVVDESRWYSDLAPNTITAAAGATLRGRERRRVAWPHALSTSGVSRWRHTQPHSHARTYFEHKQKCSSTATAAVTTGAVQPDLDSDDSVRDFLLFPDYPCTGTSVRCAAMRAGCLGGVQVGHIVSFLIRSTAPHAGQYIANPSSAKLFSSADLVLQGPARLRWRRVLHWEVDVEREEDRQRRQAATPMCSKPCDDEPQSCQSNRHLGGSWMYSHWWLSRPLVLEHVRTHTSPPPCPHSDICCDVRGDATQQISHDPWCSAAAAPPPTTLYAYGGHPASLPLYMAEGCVSRGAYPAGAWETTMTTTEGSEEGAQCLAVSSTPSAQGGQQPRRCCAAFLSAVHLHECRAPPTPPSLTVSATSDSAAPWWDGFLRCPCCAHLQLLNINLEGADTGRLEDRATVAVPAGSAEQVVGVVPPPSASPPRSTLDSLVSDKGRAPLDGRSRQPLLERRRPQMQAVSRAADFASSAQLRLWTPVLRYITEVHLTSSATLRDIGFLGELPALRLADVSLSASLTDAGVRGLCRSETLRVIDMSYCPQVDAAAAELVRCLVQLEELYLSGTGLTDATLRTVAAYLRSGGGTPRETTPVCGTDAPASGRPCDSPRADRGRQLRVLHALACRQLRNPYRALASAGSTQRSQRRPRGGGGGARGPSCWAGLQELRISAVAIGERHHESGESRSRSSDSSGTPREDRIIEMGDATERVADAAEASAGVMPSSLEGGPAAVLHQARGGSLPVSSSSPLASESAAAGVKESRSAVSEMTAVDLPGQLTPPLSFLWESLTTLVFTDTKFRCALGDVGQLPSLLRLSLRRCSVEVGERPGAGEGAHRPWLSGLEHSAFLHTVHLDGCSASAIRGIGSLQVLARLPSLQNVSLSHTSVRDADLDAFVVELCRGGATASQHQFRRLCLRACGSIAHVGAVALLSSVRSLDLSDTAVRQEVLDALGSTSAAQGSGRSHALQVLNCSACSLIADLSPLAHLRHLRWLDVSHTPVTTAAVAALRFCSSLTHLTLKNCPAVHHVRDVMAIASLEVLNAQGSGLYDSDGVEGEEGGQASAEASRVAGQSRRRSFTPSTRLYNLIDPAPYRDDSRALENDSSSRPAVVDVFPGNDDLLYTSSLHTLLLCHTRVRRICRLGLLPSLMCLDLSSTAVTDSELVKFVCTGLAVAGKGAPDERSGLGRSSPVVVHSLSAVRLDENAGQGPRGPPLRLLSLQFCRGIFSVGVLGLCPHLTKLDVSSSNVTSQGLLGLHRSTSLVQLRLLACKSVHDVRALQLIPSLTEVDGSGCNVHSGCITGTGMRGRIGTSDAEDGGRRGAEVDENGERLSSSRLSSRDGDAAPMAPPVLCSDLLQESGWAADDLAAMRRVTEGLRLPTAALFQVDAFLSCSPVRTRGLKRLVLDGCVNIRSLVEFGVLPFLLELSLCNCRGITAACVAELASPSQSSSRPSGAVSLPSVAASSAPPLPAPFASLHTLRFSSCRNLTGSLAGLELLPKLRYVHVDRCGITSVSEVVPALRRRVVL
ncbi:hypothetical protein CUR178_02706 [Leishmania enriettii]|uniref:Leucine-rich repeat protein n=1 Tax=Leishmania enriettii TaxID=5663 RepID=A0A836KIM7_LEIEN|nr:hypothetical protein CUR178_02706 [Leishmania enriettii]